MQTDHFVVDGHERARAGIAEQIRPEITARYGERLAAASFLERWRLRQLIEREVEAEVERRVKCEAPADALY